MESVFELHNQLLNISESINKKQAELMKSQSLIDKEICDIYHKIEMEDIKHISEGYNLYKTLKIALIKRRKIKDELSFLQTFQCKVADPNVLKSILGSYNKKIETRTYTKRIGEHI